MVLSSPSWSWDNSAPIAENEASQSKINKPTGLGKARQGALLRADLSCSKTISCRTEVMPA